MLPKSVDVLIIGAGPTGLALAISLQQAGINHLLIEKLPQGQNTSRAAVIHAHTLEVLDALGVSTQLADEGLKLPSFTIRDRDQTLLRLGFDHLATPHNYLLMLPQDATERILTERLLQLGGTVNRAVDAVEVTQNVAHALVCVNSVAGSQTISGKYVVGADGMHSTVRAATGTAFTGATYEESFVLADVAMDWPLGRNEVILFFSEAGLVVVAPLPGGRFRIVATLENAPEHPSIADIQTLLDTRGPTVGRATVSDVSWSSRFRLHHRLVDSYRNGRLFLMGDAAHVHSPAGGQGMNTGLVDACVLGQFLAEVVSGRQPEGFLEQYQKLRRPAASEVLGLAGRLTSMATMKDPFTRWVRNLVLASINQLPFAKRRIALNLSGLSRRAYAKIPE